MELAVTEKITASQQSIDIDSAALFDILGPENNVLLADEIMLCNAEGTVLRISETYEKNFSFPSGSVIGQSVYDLEKEGIFSPSITAEVIRTKKKVTTTQSIQGRHSVMTTGIPLFNHDGELEYVICFNTLTMEQINAIQKKYDQLLHSVRHYTEEIHELRLKNTATEDIVFKSKAMTDLWATLCHSAGTKANVLITGETGVGKSLIAKAIHNMSDRASGPFIEINCAVIHENLIESELFGYEKGAFTGANTSGKIGKIELADNGTLFLDEIGDLPLAVQTKLLDLIQTKMIERVSGTKRIKVDFRLIAATNRDLEKEMAKGLFRKDLFYRLNVLRIHIPPLRDRREDIFPLILKFLSVYNKEYDKNISVSPRLLDFLEHCPWPGNIRQLQNLIERLVILCRSHIVDINDLPSDFTPEIPVLPLPGDGKKLQQLMDDYEGHLILNSYQKNKTGVAVAKDLGISQATAARKLTKYVKK